jgi:hypothetical protein
MIYQIMALTTFTGAWTNIIFGTESAGESVQSHRVLTSQQAWTAGREAQNNAIPRTPVSLMDDYVVNKRRVYVATCICCSARFPAV